MDKDKLREFLRILASHSRLSGLEKDKCKKDRDYKTAHYKGGEIRGLGLAAREFKELFNAELFQQ